VPLGFAAALAVAAVSRIDPVLPLSRAAEGAAALALSLGARDVAHGHGAAAVMSAAAALGVLCSWTMAGAPRRRVGWLGCVAVATGWAGLTHAVWSLSAIELPVAVPLASAVAGASVAGVARKLVRLRSYARLCTGFGSIVSPTVLKQLADDPTSVALHGERRDVTILVAGIRGFDRLADRLPPLEIVALVQDWLTPAAEIVLDRGGTLDECPGGRLVAFFGAPVAWPDHGARACSAALAIRARVRELNAEWRRHGLRTIDVGIGLASGPATVGDVGADERFRYGVVGAPVGLAGRIMECSADWGVAIAAAERVAVSASERFAFREIDLAPVGRDAQPVRVFELAGRTVDAVVSRPFLVPYESALAAYRAGDLLRAERLFHQAKWTRPADGPCTLWLKRIAVERASAQRSRGA
jgi:adenylate cyclase